jgi:hypothetical protein
MNRTAGKIFYFALAACTACTGLAYGEAGLTAAPALNAPLGARSSGMGRAFTAVMGGAESLNYNPGALAFEKGFSITASYLRGFEDVGHGFIAAPLPLGPLVLTPGFMYFSGGDINLNLSDGTTGKVNAENDRAVYASAACKLGGRLGVGLTAKHVRVELAETASAAALLWDFGALYSAGRGVTLGAAYLNSGGGFRFEQAADPAPAVKRLGAAWLVEINPPNLMDPSADLTYSEAIFSADWTGYYKDKGYYQAGMELNMTMSLGLIVSFRTGYLFDRPAEGLTLGFGIAGRDLAFDFSFSPAKAMNTRQQAGLTYKF